MTGAPIVENPTARPISLLDLQYPPLNLKLLKSSQSSALMRFNEHAQVVMIQAHISCEVRNLDRKGANKIKTKKKLSSR